MEKKILMLYCFGISVSANLISSPFCDEIPLIVDKSPTWFDHSGCVCLVIPYQVNRGIITHTHHTYTIVIFTLRILLDRLLLRALKLPLAFSNSSLKVWFVLGLRKSTHNFVVRNCVFHSVYCLAHGH